MGLLTLTRQAQLHSRSDDELGWRRLPGDVDARCKPNPLVGAVHTKAVPVILHAEDHDRWLVGGIDDVGELAAPYPPQLMDVA